MQILNFPCWVWYCLKLRHIQPLWIKSSASVFAACRCSPFYNYRNDTPFLEKLFPLSAVLLHLCVSCKSHLLLVTLLALPQHVGCCPPLLQRSYITSLPDPLLLIHLLQQLKLTVCKYSNFNFHTGGTVHFFHEFSYVFTLMPLFQNVFPFP